MLKNLAAIQKGANIIIQTVYVNLSFDFVFDGKKQYFAVRSETSPDQEFLGQKFGILAKIADEN